MKRNLATLIAVAGLIVMTTPSNTFAGNDKGGKPAKTKKQGGGSKPSAPASGKDEIYLANVREQNPGKGGGKPNQNPNQQNNDDCAGKCGGNFSYEDYLAMKHKIREYKARERLDRKDCVATRKAINGDYRAQYRFYQALQRQKGVGKVTQGTATAKLPGALFFKIPFEDKKGAVTTRTYPSTPACYRLIMNQYYGGCQTLGESLAAGVENRRFENKWSEVEFSKDVIAGFDKDGNINTCEAVDEKVVNNTPAPAGNGSLPDSTFEGPAGHEAVSTVAVGDTRSVAPVGTPTGTPTAAPTAAEAPSAAAAASGTVVATEGEIDAPADQPTTTPTDVPTTTPTTVAAAPVTSPSSSTAVAPADLEALKQQLAEKDEMIKSLEARIKALEGLLQDKESENIALNREIADLRNKLADCQEAKKKLEETVVAPVASTTNDEVEVDLGNLPEDQKPAPTQARRKITINLTGVNLPSADEIVQITQKLSEKFPDADVVINATASGTGERVADNTSKPAETRVPSAPTNTGSTGTTPTPGSSTAGSVIAEEDIWSSTPAANDETPAPQPTTAVEPQPEPTQVAVTPPSVTQPNTPVVKKPKKKKPECAIAGTCFEQTFTLAVSTLCRDLKNYKGDSCQFVASVSNNKNSAWYKELAKSVKKHGDKMDLAQLRSEGFFDTSAGTQTNPGKWWEVVKTSKDASNPGFHHSLDHKPIANKAKVLMKVRT